MRLKRLELWWRGLWIRVLVRLMRRGAAGPPTWDAGPVRVLFLRHDRAGDMIVSTGVMRAIARSHPTITLDVLASPANAGILDDAEYVDRVIVFDKRKLSSYLPTALRLRRAGYDAVIDCMVTAPSLTTLLLIFASGARQRIGIAGRGNDAAFTLAVAGDPRADAHMVHRIGALAAAFGVDPAVTPLGPVLSISSAERDWANAAWTASHPRALINVSAGAPSRVWPEANYIAAMRRLAALDARVVLRVLAAPADAERGARIAREGGGAFVSTPTFRQALALVATSDFVLTPDTSIAHAASAFQKPAVGLYLRDSATRWGLYGTRGENVSHPGPTMAALPVDDVLAAIERVWREVATTSID